MKENLDKAGLEHLWSMLKSKFIRKTGDTISGSLKMSAIKLGYFLKDRSGIEYPGLYDNGANLWVGAYESTGTHHSGNTYISTGYKDKANGEGFQSIFISVPNSNGANNYRAYHEGYKPSKSDVGLSNVENKSSATIRGELTKANVTNALGYTPPTTDTTYSDATQSTHGLMSTSDKKKLDSITGNELIKAVTVTLSYVTVNANTGALLNDTNVSDHVPNGYSALAAIPSVTGSNGLYFYNCGITSAGKFYIQLRNVTSNAITVAPRVTLLCVKNI